MRHLTVWVKKVLGQPNPLGGKWSGSLVFEPEDESLLRRRGRLFAVLDLTGSPALDLQSFGNLSLEALKEAYYASEEASPFEALEAAIHKAQHRLVELVFGPKGAVPDGALNYNFAVASLWGAVLYLAKLGAAGLYLYRGGVVGELGEAKNEKVFSASGMVQDGDVAILGSIDFRRTFSASKLSKSLDNLDLLVASLGSPSGVSALVLRIKLASVPGKEEELVIAPVVGGKPKKFFPAVLFLTLVGLFLWASAFTIQKRQVALKASEAAALISKADQELAEAKQYVDLNNSSARELLLEAQLALQSAGRLGVSGTLLTPKLAETTSLLDQVNNVKRLKDLEIVYDFKIQNAAASPTSISGTADSLLVAEPATGAVFEVLTSKTPPPVENVLSQKISGVRAVRIFEENLFILTETGVSRLNLKTLKLDQDVLVAGGESGEIKHLGIYLGNIYLLSPAKNQILKSVVGADGEYSIAKDWLESTADISDALALAIDGSIYVLKSDGNILKFEKGALASDFRLKEFDRPLTNPRAIFTSDSLEHLYILDAGNKRIVVTDKNGLYRSQYLYEGPEAFLDPKDLFVDEKAGKIFLLDGTKVFEVAL